MLKPGLRNKRIMYNLLDTWKGVWLDEEINVLCTSRGILVLTTCATDFLVCPFPLVCARGSSRNSLVTLQPFTNKHFCTS